MGQDTLSIELHIVLDCLPRERDEHEARSGDNIVHDLTRTPS